MPISKMPKELAVPKPTANKNPLFNFFLQTFVIALIFFVVGFLVGKKNFTIEKKGFVPKINVENQLPPANQNLDFSLFWQVVDTLPKKFLDKSQIDSEKILYGAISGAVRSLGDPYTVFLDPKQNEAIRNEIAGSYQGVGIQIGFNKDKNLVVVAPLKGSPAEREGIKAKDLILKIGDKLTFDMTLPEAVELIRGNAGSKVKLVLQHEGDDKSYEKDITRELIDVKSIDVTYRDFEDKKIAIIKVSRFGEKTNEEWDKVVSEALSRGVRGLVVDMRNNPGGLLSSSVYLGSEFTRNVIVKQEFADRKVESIAADHEGKLLKMPVIVLINGGSASAAEIFAGAIQDHNRGKIVGEQSFGKGTVQDVLDLPGGSGLHVTVAKWLTPDGHSIHESGIKPDEEVKDDEATADVDEQLEKAVDLL